MSAIGISASDCRTIAIYQHTHREEARMAGDRPRRPRDARDAAEQAFKVATTKPAEPLPKPASLPGAKEMVSLRIDRDVLDHFPEGRPGCQARINAALRKA